MTSLVNSHLHVKKEIIGTSLVAQWSRIHLPMQGTRVRALVQEDPTCRGATKPVHHDYWACALEPVSHNYWAHVPQLLKPAHLEPMLHNKKPPQWEACAPQWRVAPARCNYRKPTCSNEDPTQPKIINKLINLKNILIVFCLCVYFEYYGDGELWSRAESHSVL